MDVIERIADGLHIPGHLLGLAQRNWEPSTPAVQQVDTAASIETWDILDTLTRSTASPEALLHLEAAVLQNAMLYPSTPPMQLIPSMKRQLAKVHEFIGHPQSIKARRRCIQLIGVLGGLLGLAFLDTGDTGQSSALIHLGQVAAEEADDDGLTAWLLTMQSVVLYSTHRTDQAVEILSRAEHLAISAPPRRQAWVSANLARAHAAEGNRPEALAALDRAGHSLCYGGDAGGLDFFNTARLDGISGNHALPAPGVRRRRQPPRHLPCRPVPRRREGSGPADVRPRGMPHRAGRGRRGLSARARRPGHGRRQHCAADRHPGTVTTEQPPAVAEGPGGA